MTIFFLKTMVTFQRVTSMGRSRQIIIPIRAHSCPIENVADAGARAECIRQSLAEFAQQTPHQRFHDYLPGAVYWLGYKK